MNSCASPIAFLLGFCRCREEHDLAPTYRCPLCDRGEWPGSLLLRIGWPEALQHRVVLGIEGLQLRVLGFCGSSQDGVCKADAV